MLQRLFIGCVCLLLAMSARSLVDAQIAQWSSFEQVDIYNEHAGDFIDRDWQEMVVQARQAYAKKQYERAAQLYLYLLQFDKTEAIHIYNLACCYALLNKPHLAALYLRRALAFGFTDYAAIAKDQDFQGVRGNAELDTLMAGVEHLSKNLGELLYVEGKKMIK